MIDFDESIATEDFVVRVDDEIFTWTGAVSLFADETVWLELDEPDGSKSWLQTGPLDGDVDVEITRRLRLNRPAGEGFQSITLTYVNDRFTTPGGRPARQLIELWAARPFSADDFAGEVGDALTRVDEVAADVWIGADWEHWWIESVALDGVPAYPASS